LFLSNPVGISKSVTDAIAPDSTAGKLFLYNKKHNGYKLGIILCRFFPENLADVKKDNEPRFGNAEMPVSSVFASGENQLKACMIFEYICIIYALPFWVHNDLKMEIRF